MPLVRRRRPLLRAAAVGGAAYMAGKRKGESGYEQPEAMPPQQGAGASPSTMDQLKTAAELHDRGVLTDAEFEQQKQALLSGGG
jgi:Short C-terminal domain